MTAQIQVRRDTAANWTTTNPTLANGELGYETDTGKLKVGNGSTAWTSLAYFSGAAAATWTTLTMASGYASHADNFGFAPAYAKVGDRVHLRGTFRPSSGTFTGNSALTITTLPAGYRPAQNVYLAVAAQGSAGGGVGRLDILTTGSVNFYTYQTGVGWASLDGASFPA